MKLDRRELAAVFADHHPGVPASSVCDIGQVAYEMTLLVDRVGQILTPELRAALQGAAGRMVGQPA